MNITRFLLGGFLLLSAFSTLRAADDTRVYELRTYTAHPGKTANVLARFRDHTVKLFEKQGMVNLGYFVPLDAADGSADKLVYVLAHASRDAAKASWSAFSADPDWVAARKASELEGKIVAKAESIFMAPADYSPAIKSSTAAAPRVFELRTYTAAEGKLAALDARFREHTLKLFAKHGIVSLAYWHPTDAEKGAATTLIYLVSYPSRETAVASWAAFHADPEWIAAKAASEQKAGGSLTTSVKSVFLAPTDFSATK